MEVIHTTFWGRACMMKTGAFIHRRTIPRVEFQNLLQLVKICTSEARGVEWLQVRVIGLLKFTSL
eukprot:146303-Amphidinium_carterae.1